MIKIVTLVSLLCAVSAAAEYYSVLGLNRGVGIPEIKKAFKKLAVKFHPDRAPEEQKEEFNKKFSEISDAYSVLTDQELKNVYDHHGHHGLEELRKQKDWQNQQNAHQEYHQSMVTDHFANTDLTILNTQSLPRFYRRSQVWLVLFYRSQDHEMRGGLKEAILELNTKFYGVFVVAAVNCDQDEAICDEYRATNTPDIFAFTSDITHDGMRYTGDKTAAKMAGFAVSHMQHFVSIVTPLNVNEFVQTGAKIKMLVFSDKKEPSPLVKALSKEFRTSVEVGQVKDEGNEVANRFGVNSLPHVVIVKSKGEEVVHYDGQINVGGLSDFIREHRENGGKVFKKQRSLLKVEKRGDLERNGCGSASKSVCVLIPYSSDPELSQIRESMLQIFDLLGDDPTIIQIINSSLLNYDGLGLSTSTRIVVFKPSKQRIHSHIESSFNSRDLLNILDKVVGGSLQFENMKVPNVFLDGQTGETDL